MTISLKADASGNSGSIQVSGNDKLIVNADGSLVATVNPATGVRSNALATMQKFADEFGASLAANGYQKLPSGLIIQWGQISGGTGNSDATTFPIAFPNAVFSVTATVQHATAGSSGGLETIHIEDVLNNTGFTSSRRAQGGATTLGTTQPAFWVAIGY